MAILRTLAVAGVMTAAASAQLQVPMVNMEKLNIETATAKVSGDKPLVDSQALQDLITSDSLFTRSKDLYAAAELSQDEYNHPTRVIGSPGHLGTLAYVYTNLAALGDYYTLSNQTFPAVTGSVSEFRLVLGKDVPASTSAMGLTPPTKDHEPVQGLLVSVENDGCDASDFPDTVSGNIAFIKRGTCPFGTKSELAGLAGAIAAVVYNHEDGEVHGTLGTPKPNHVATFGISNLDALPIVEKLSRNEEVHASAYMNSDVSTIHTDNIIAQTTGGDQENCVMLGGHSDSVAEGPGINDDGTGSMTLLEIATQLAKFEVNNCVRFAWWSGEEEGLLGSDYYVDVLPEEENLKIRLFMDYDMLASPNYAYQVYDANNDDNPNGSGDLKKLYVDWYESQGLNYTFIPFDGRSDYDGFIRHGIPGGGIATGAEGIKTKEEEEMFGGKAGDWFDPCYHQLCDDLTNLDLEAWQYNARLVAHSVATYALSFDGFPKRTLDSEAVAAALKKPRKYIGKKLAM
jgi:aminopeptidase Y